MSFSYHDEQRSFLIFFIFFLISAFSISFFNSNLSLSVLSIIWGVFGFLRFIYLNQKNFLNISKLFDLPSKILFGLYQKQEKNISNTLKRLEHPDILYWMGGGFIFILWALFCSFLPDDIPALDGIEASQRDVLGDNFNAAYDVHMIIKQLSFYVMTGAIIFISLSYALYKQITQRAFYFGFAIFILFAFSILFLTARANFILLPDMSVFKGAGLGQSYILEIITPDMMRQSGTSLMRRYVETGMVGAWGMYIVFAPVFIMLLKNIFDQKGRNFKNKAAPFCCIFIIATLAMIDIFWIFTPLLKGLYVLGWGTVALVWGSMYEELKIKA